MPEPMGAQATREQWEHDLREFRAEGGHLKCDDRPDLYADYEIHGGAPSVAEAKQLCTGCKMIFKCRNFGNITRPGHGIWGGVRWENGRPSRIDDPEELAA